MPLTQTSLVPKRARQKLLMRASCVAVVVTMLFAACSSEDEERRLTRELEEAQVAMKFCDDAPANCDVEELAKRNATLSDAENALNNFRKKK